MEGRPKVAINRASYHNKGEGPFFFVLTSADKKNLPTNSPVASVAPALFDTVRHCPFRERAFFVLPAHYDGFKCSLCHARIVPCRPCSWGNLSSKSKRQAFCLGLTIYILSIHATRPIEIKRPIPNMRLSLCDLDFLSVPSRNKFRRQHQRLGLPTSEGHLVANRDVAIIFKLD